MDATSAFNAKTAARKLLREGRSGALATLMVPSGDPYCSLVNVATDFDGSPILLISRLALHTKNILSDPRVSLMLDERKEGDPLQGARVMLMGRAARTDDAQVRRRYLTRQPEASAFADFQDFAFYRVALAGAHLVAGFGRIVDLKRQDILLDVSGADELLAAEEDAVVHMNEDHADACRLYATKLLGAPDGEWRCAGVDPEGMELQHGRLALRLLFPQRVTGPGALRAVLKQLADEARTKS
ncbi:HugZ family protein [Methyloceanibacter sp.]|uniref:HugZ family pyridoxamine 5'-phosphate oxidase n=1 Tax=Methyloceanibacter sp. TaxID=1965321 RepID=UPI00351B8E10